MMASKKCLFGFLMLFVCLSGYSQRIIYSTPGKDDIRRMNFEVVGKVGSNFLIYKSIRGINWISVLDNEMNEIAKVEHDYLPNDYRLVTVDFISYGTFSYMIYQYQKKSIVYCMAAKIDGNGKRVGDVMELDTTKLAGSWDNKIYNFISSEDKSKILLFKINSKNRKNYLLTTLLFNDKLELSLKSQIGVPMEDRDENISEFQLDNDGDLIFSKYETKNNDRISNASFVIKSAKADTLVYKHLNLEKLNLDDIRIKVDNYNKQYFLTSYFYKERRGNVDGLYFYIWSKATGLPTTETAVEFNEELRKEAKGESSVGAAFNDYFIKNIICRKDGGFIITSESTYTTSRFNSWSRWNYFDRYYSSISPYYLYSPYYNSYWNSRWYNSSNNQPVRYHADNITVSSFDKNGRSEWNSVIVKSQFDDDSDDFLSYLIMITGGQLHFLFNQNEKRIRLLTDFGLSPSGELDRNPTLKNLDRGYEFMPRFSKQVSAKQIIIPCQTKNYICFAKVEYE